MQCDKTDKTVAYKWFFDPDTGMLLCEHCKFRGRGKEYAAIMNSSDASLHPLSLVDLTFKRKWYLYCQNFAGCDVNSGIDQDDRAQRYHAIRKAFLDDGAMIDYAARDS